MDPCKEYEPQVINHNMIERCLEEQGLKGELGRLAREEGIPWDEVLNIRLEFMRILRIDHLWVLPALTTLSLSNNLIEEIENLESLVNLKELDLSFNKIKQIENLDTLVNLEILNLFDNEINFIENMDSLTKLIIFSIGKNNIADRKNVLYLRRFKNLKSVNMAGNRCAEAPNFRSFVAIFLPNVVYYEYKMFEQAERDEGQKLYARELIELETVECKTRDREEKLQAEIAEAERNSESFVEFLGTNHLFEQMFENDTDGKLLLKMGDEARDYYNEFEVQFVLLAQQIFAIGQEQYLKRKEEVDQFTAVTEGAKTQNQQDSIDHMEIFGEMKRKVCKEIEVYKRKYDNGTLQIKAYNEKIDEMREEYHKDIHKDWKVLMGLELTLFEQMEEVNQSFEQAMTEMVNNFIETAQGFFAQMRNCQGTYNEQIGEMALRYMTTMTITPDMPVPPDIVHLFADRDALTNIVNGSHDLHLLVIDNREDRLVRRAKAWLNGLVNDLQKNEISRSRAKILEISHYLDVQREDFETAIVLQELNTDL